MAGYGFRSSQCYRGRQHRGCLSSRSSMTRLAPVLLMSSFTRRRACLASWACMRSLALPGSHRGEGKTLGGTRACGSPLSYCRALELALASLWWTGARRAFPRQQSMANSHFSAFHFVTEFTETASRAFGSHLQWPENHLSLTIWACEWLVDSHPTDGMHAGPVSCAWVSIGCRHEFF